MKIVALADTHGQHDQLQVPDGDVLIHAGDMCGGNPFDYGDFNQWIGTLPHPHKIVIAGNPDALFEDHADCLPTYNYTYLQDEATTIDGVKFYGSPWTPPFLDWAFMAESAAIAKKWALIPQDTDVLITHGPPWGVGDVVRGEGHQGCADLMDAVLQVKPRFHVFGHIHEGYGMYGLLDRPTYINASVLNEYYQMVNAPTVIEI